VCKSQTSLSKAYAKLCGGAGCPPWRSGGGEMPACAARPTEGPTVYMCVRKRKRRSGRCSPGLESSVGVMQGVRRRVAAAFGDGSVRGCPRLRISTGSCGVVL